MNSAVTGNIFIVLMNIGTSEIIKLFYQSENQTVVLYIQKYLILRLAYLLIKN